MTFLADASLILLVVLGLFLVLVVLLQRGRGGGLAGALGGAGGQSAFGTKAGDVFTRITIIVAALWFILAGVSGALLRASNNSVARQIDDGNVVDEEEIDSSGYELGEAPTVPPARLPDEDSLDLDALEAMSDEAAEGEAATPDDSPALPGSETGESEAAAPGESGADDAPSEEAASEEAAGDGEQEEAPVEETTAAE